MNMFPQALLDSLIPAIAIGIALVIAVTITIRLLSPVSAATRTLVWLITLCALPVIQVLSVVGNAPSAAPAKVPIQQTVRQQTPALATEISTPTEKIIGLAPARTAPILIPAPYHFAPSLLAVYSLFAAALLFRLLISYLRLCLLRRRTYPAPADLASRLDLWQNRCPTGRPVTLRLSNHARSPLAIGWLKPMIVMPAALVLELSQEEFDNLGCHELAHLRRYDDWTNLLQRILQAFLFFHPAAYYLGRQLNLDREIACDDWVINGQASKAYARSLTKVIELRRYQRGTLLLSSGAFFGKRQILKRVETLLDKSRNTATTVSVFTVIVAAILVTAILSQVSHLPAVIAFTQSERDGTHIRMSDDSRTLSINYAGEISFSPDEQSIQGLSPSGYLTIDESKNWSHRRIEVTPDPTGLPVVKYFLDGREKPLDGVGRAWAAENYLFVLRETGFDAEARVNRILASRGINGVLQEVDLIHSDQVKLQYLNQLLNANALKSGDLRRLADTIAKISGDSEKAEFLLAHQHEFLTADLRTSYFRAVNSIHSDDDRRRVLKSVLETDGTTPETAHLVGASAKEMQSDNDKAEVLMAMPATAAGDTHCALLKAARTIQSDDEKARVLTESGYAGASQCREDYFTIVNEIQSDNDHANVLETILKSGNLSPETEAEIASSVKRINSDDEKANVLVALGAVYSDAPLFDAADTIQSSDESVRTLRAVFEHDKSKLTLLRAIQSTARISGDDQKTAILVDIAKLSKDQDVETALQQACQKLASDNDYRQLASNLFESSKSVTAR